MRMLPLVYKNNEKILSLACLLQSNEVGGSCHMEKEGLRRCVQDLAAKNLSVDVLVTDRHPQIQKWVRENMPETTHYYDVWHVAKGILVQFLRDLGL